MLSQDFLDLDITFTEDDFKEDAEVLHQTNSHTCSIQDLTKSFSILQKILPQVFNLEFLAFLQNKIQENQHFSENSDINGRRNDSKQNNSKNYEATQNQAQSNQNQGMSLDLEQKKKKVAEQFCLKISQHTAGNSKSIDHIMNNEQQEQHLYQIIIGVFKKLEQYLASQGLLPAWKTNSANLKLIYKTGINCGAMLNESVCRSFTNTIKGIYQIQDYDGVTIEQAVELYNQFMIYQQDPENTKDDRRTPQPIPTYQHKHQKDIVIDRKSTILVEDDGFQKQEKYQMHKIWNAQHEKQLLSLLRTDNKFVNICKKMKEIFPKDENVITTQALRSKFNKIIRLGIKKLTELAQSTHQPIKLPNLVKLNDNRLRMILHHNKAKSARGLIIDVYERQGLDAQLSERAIKAINDFIASQEVEAQSQEWMDKRPIYHPKIKNGKKQYGRYNRPYDPNREKTRFKNEEEYVDRPQSEDQKSDFDPHSDNESVYSIF